MTQLKFSCLSFVLVTLLATGCEPQDQIVTREVAKSEKPQATDVDAVAAGLDHMLAAMVPQGQKAGQNVWFLKLVVPGKTAARHRKDFLAFLGSMKLADDATQTPTWQAPEGWEEKPGSGLRVATFSVPDESGAAELTVTSLPVVGDWESYVANNVNRWLGQLQQGALRKRAISQMVKTVTLSGADGAKATWVELVGVMPGQTGSMPGGHSHPPLAGKSAAPAAVASPPATGAQPTEPAPLPLEFRVPESWQPGRSGGMRKAAFLIADGDAHAEVTVIDLPTLATGGVADVGANVRRWASQVGLGGLGDDELAKLTQPVRIDGIEGSQAMLLGPADGEQPQGLLVAMIEREGRVWFFKLIGDRQLAESQKRAFASFLESVKFQ